MGWRYRAWWGRAKDRSEACLMCALVVALHAAGGADAQEHRTITLRDAIEQAVKTNTSALQASNRVASGEVSFGQAKAQFYPDLTVGVSGSERDSWSSDGEEGTGASARSMSGRVSSGVTLFDGFANVNSLRAARLDLLAARASQDYVRQTVIFQTTSAFLDVLMNAELVKSARDNLEAQRQQLALVERFYDAGNRSLADVLQQRAVVAQAELQVLNAERTEGVSKLSLLSTIGVAPTAEYDAAPLPIKDIVITPTVSSPDSILDGALARRADLAEQRMRLDAASLQVSAARAGYWPSVSLSASASSGYSNQNQAGFSDQFLDINPESQVGISLSLPIFDRFKTKASVEQAGISLRNQSLGLASLERTVALQVSQALLDYETAAKRRDAADAQLAYAEQALAATTERYRVGAATLVELTASRAQYADASNERVRANYNLLLTWLAMGYYAGDFDAVLALLG